MIWCTRTALRTPTSLGCAFCARSGWHRPSGCSSDSRSPALWISCLAREFTSGEATIKIHHINGEDIPPIGQKVCLEPAEFLKPPNCHGREPGLLTGTFQGQRRDALQRHGGSFRVFRGSVFHADPRVVKSCRDTCRQSTAAKHGHGSRTGAIYAGAAGGSEIAAIPIVRRRAIFARCSSSKCP